MRSNARRRMTFRAFVKKEMQYRKWMHYPPHATLANIIIQSPRLEEAAGWAASLGKCFRRHAARTCARTGARERAHRAHQAYLSLSPFAEVGKAAGPGADACAPGLAQAEALGIPRRNLIVDVDAVNLM